MFHCQLFVKILELTRAQLLSSILYPSGQAGETSPKDEILGQSGSLAGRWIKDRGTNKDQL